MSSMVEWIIASSALIVMVTVLRFWCRGRVKPMVQYALWLPVLLRLLIPFSFVGSAFSIANLLPEAEERQAWADAQEKEIEVLITGSSLKAGHPWNQRAMASAPSNGLSASGDLSNQLLMVGNPLDQLPVAENPSSQLSTAGGSFHQLSPSALPGQPGTVGSQPKPPLDRKVRVPWWCLVWLGGLIFFALLLTGFHAVFTGQVYRSRKPLRGVDSRLPVYVTAAVQSPCMFGLKFPAIYLPAAWDEENLGFVLRHENTHFVHRDHIWAYLRLLAVCVHWYNPLVWLASALSRQDGELACDAAAVAGLDECGRLEYGQALIAVSARTGYARSGFGLAASMSGSKRRLRERIVLIARKPVMKLRTFAAMSLSVMFAVMATFTGRTAEAKEPVGGGSATAESAEAVGNMSDATGAMDVSTGDGHSLSAGTDIPDIGAGTDKESAASWMKEADFTHSDGSTYRLAWEVSGVPGSGAYELGSLSLYRLEAGEAVRQLEHIDPVAAGPDLPYGEGDLPLSSLEDGGVVLADINFDGWTDLYFPLYTENEETLYSCYLWKPELSGLAYAFSMQNLEVQEAQKEISSKSGNGKSEEVTHYYRLDEEGNLYYVRTQWANVLPDGEREVILTLHYSDCDEAYSVSAKELADDQYPGWENVSGYARQALEELYQWSGTRVGECWYNASDLGDLNFAVSEENLKRQHFFYSRGYGMDLGLEAVCNICVGYEAKSDWWDGSVVAAVQPPREEDLPSESLCSEDMEPWQMRAALNSVWFLEHNAIGKGEKAEAVSPSYENAYVIKTTSGNYYEADVNPATGVPCSIFGPYESYPYH